MGTVNIWRDGEIVEIDEADLMRHTPEEISVGLSLPLPGLSDRQFFQGLAEREIITWDEAFAAIQTGTVPQTLVDLINAAIEDEMDRKRALFLVAGAVTFEFSNPLVPMIGARYEWDEEQLRDFWRFCASL